MVYITIIQGETTITLKCHKNTRDGEIFQLVIDAKTGEVLERPSFCDVDVSTAYGHVYSLMKSGEPLPKETVAAWG